MLDLSWADNAPRHISIRNHERQAYALHKFTNRAACRHESCPRCPELLGLGATIHRPPRSAEAR